MEFNVTELVKESLFAALFLYFIYRSFNQRQITMATMEKMVGKFMMAIAACCDDDITEIRLEREEFAGD